MSDFQEKIDHAFPPHSPNRLPQIGFASNLNPKMAVQAIWKFLCLHIFCCVENSPITGRQHLLSTPSSRPTCSIATIDLPLQPYEPRAQLKSGSSSYHTAHTHLSGTSSGLSSRSLRTTAPSNPSRRVQLRERAKQLARERVENAPVQPNFVWTTDSGHVQKSEWY